MKSSLTTPSETLHALISDAWTRASRRSDHRWPGPGGTPALHRPVGWGNQHRPRDPGGVRRRGQPQRAVQRRLRGALQPHGEPDLAQRSRAALPQR